MTSPSARPEGAAPDQAPMPPGSGRLLLILSASGFSTTFSSRALDPLVGIMARDLHSAPDTIALLSAAFALPYAFIQPILGPIGDAIGKERVMKIALALLTLALAGSVVAPDTQSLFVLRVLAGAAAGGVVPLTLALIGDRIGIGQRQMALSRFLASVIVGQLAGVTLAGVLALWVGWRGVLALSTALMLLAFAATAAGFRGGAPAGRFDLGVALARYRGIVANPRARALFALVFFEAIAVFSVFPYLAPLLEQHGGGPAEAGLALGGFAIGGLLFSALVGWMIAHLGLRRMLLSGGALAAIALAVVGLTGHWLWYCGAFVVLGFGFYTLHSSFQTQVTEVAPQARASAVSLHAFSYFVGQSLGVALLGLSLGLLGQAPSLMLAALLVLAVGLAAARVLAPRR